MGKGRQPGTALGSLLKIGFSLALLAFVLRQVGWQQTWQSLRAAKWPYLAAALGLALAGMLVRAYRWKVLLDALGWRTPLSRLTALYFIGMFFNNFLPTGVGGDVVRVYELARHSAKPAQAVGTVLLDRATGLLVLFLMALLALPFSYRLVGPEVAAAILVLSALGWGGTALVLKRDWLERWGLLRLVARVRQLEEVYESVHACGPKAIAGALVASLVYNLLLIAMNHWIALSLGVRVSVWYFLAFVPLISFLLVLPVSLSGLGLREGGYVYLFSQAGVAAPLALTMGLIVYAINVATGSIGGVLYALEGVRGLRAEVDE